MKGNEEFTSDTLDCGLLSALREERKPPASSET
jgi:hypothetical protein